MAQGKKIKWRALITLIGAITLVGTELVGVSWAAGWALGGLLQMSQTFSLVAECIGALLGLFLVIAFTRAAIAHEPIFTSDGN